MRIPNTVYRQTDDKISKPLLHKGEVNMGYRLWMPSSFKVSTVIHTVNEIIYFVSEKNWQYY